MKSENISQKKINITISTGMNEKGGVASVINVLNVCFFQKWRMVHISSHTNNSHVYGLVKVLTFLKAVLKLISLLATKNIGVVHVHMASRGSYSRKSIFVRLAKLFGTKAIIHLHGGEFSHFYNKECNEKKKAHIRKTFDLADAIIVLSSQWKSWVTSTLAETKKVHLIYNSVEAINVSNTMKQKGQILYLGRLSDSKGVKDLITAFSIVAEKIPYARLALGGDGETKNYSALASQLGIKEKIEFLGWVSGSDKIAWLSKSDVYCLPSYNEGFPMGILEAMSANVPVVASTVGGIPDAIESGVDGLLIEAGDVEKLAEHITALIIDREMNDRLSSQAKRKFTNHFSQQAVFPKLDLIYSDLTGE